MTDIVIPTIHLNGTSKQALLDQFCNAIGAIRVAANTLAAAYPNGRDYYPQSASAINMAMHQHEARITKLREVMAELEQIAEAICRLGAVGETNREAGKTR